MLIINQKIERSDFVSGRPSSAVNLFL